LESLQSIAESQSLSIPSVQSPVSADAVAQSVAHEPHPSPPLQTPSPHTGGGPQSISQLELFSPSAQVRSPQHRAVTGSVVH
jgi:hypothetical protein